MLQRLTAKLYLPVALLIIVLQRAPQIYHTFFSRITLPSLQFVQKAFFTTSALGATHALSGATVSRYSVGDSTYTVGAQLILHRETGKVGDLVQIGLSNTVTAVSWTVEGELPAGLRMTDIFQQTQLSDGVINTAFPYLLGNYNQEGNYLVTLTPWSELNGQGEKPPQALSITFQVAAGDPQPSTPPKIRFQRSDDTLQLSWPTADAAGYQLTRSTDLVNWSPITPQTQSDGEDTLAQFPVSPSTSAFYRFEAASQ